MLTKAEVIARLIDPGVIAVVRINSREHAIPLAEALLAGGIHAIEITMTTPGALEIIQEASARLPFALLGVGTVLDGTTATEAVNAGAQFVVSPITRRDIAEAAHRQDRPVMLGAFTPTEAQTAYEYGADFIKLFPAENLGPAYVKSLRAPLPHLKIVPTGGVDLQTIGGFLQAGCSAVGAGSSLISPAAVKSGNWGEITELARKFVAAARNARAN